MPMNIEVHFEVKYDKWRQHECPPGSQTEVVVKRACFTADTNLSLEANCVAAGERVFASTPPGAPGYNHRLEIYAFRVDGVMSPVSQRVKVPVKISQLT